MEVILSPLDLALQGALQVVLVEWQASESPETWLWKAVFTGICKCQVPCHHYVHVILNINLPQMSYSMMSVSELLGSALQLRSPLMIANSAPHRSTKSTPLAVLLHFSEASSTNVGPLDSPCQSLVPSQWAISFPPRLQSLLRELVFPSVALKQVTAWCVASRAVIVWVMLERLAVFSFIM